MHTSSLIEPRPIRVGRWLVLLGVVLVGGLAVPASAWWGKGHRAASELALRLLPESVPAFMREPEALRAIGRGSIDPDFYRHDATPQLKAAEGPEHYLDLEMLEGAELPATRYEYLALIQQKGLKPEIVGVLPYALAESTQRLTLAFADVRRHPDDLMARARCVYLSAIVAHYAQDLCNPLHTSVHHDGRTSKDKNWQTPRSGIHSRSDALIQHVADDPAAVLNDLQAVNLGEVLPAVIAELRRSHALVDRLYELEPQLPKAVDDTTPMPPGPVRDFAFERLRATVAFTSSLWLTAWEASAKVRMPDWYVRAREDAGEAPAPVVP